MIKVLVSKKKIEISGHSGYDTLGKDILCSAVSSIVTTTINGIISIREDAISYKYVNDTMYIDNIKKDVVTEKLIDNMVIMLKELAEKYPKNINVKEI